MAVNKIDLTDALTAFVTKQRDQGIVEFSTQPEDEKSRRTISAKLPK